MCSTVLGAIMCIATLLSWFNDGQPERRKWQFAPFGLAIPAGVLLTYPGIVPKPWGLTLGWYLLTLVYATCWVSARVTAGRDPKPLHAIIPCTIVMLFNLVLYSEEFFLPFKMPPRVLLCSVYGGLAAFEFYRMRTPQLPSTNTLFWLFTVFCIFDFLRIPFAFFVPAPLGPMPPELWSIAIFNFMIVLQGALLCVCMTALGREQMAAEMYNLAMIDQLSGVGNRRALDERMKELSAEASNAVSFKAIAVIDIDKFKDINDTFGHAFGDIVIAGCATIGREVFGSGNIFRVGGEEFIALMNGSSRSEIMERAEKMREAFEARCHIAKGISERATISIGVAIGRQHEDLDELGIAADEALYMAKRTGRNRTISADTVTKAVSAYETAPAPRLTVVR